MKLRNLPGGVPDPEELIGRDHLIDTLWQQLVRNNIMLVAPRRFGKTGVMTHALRNPRDSYVPLYFEIEEIDTPETFATELLSALAQQDKLRDLVTSLKRFPKKVADVAAERIDEVGVEVFKVKLKNALSENWESIAKRLILELEKSDQKFVFILDEFPQMVDNISRNKGPDVARSFLAWFRSLRIRRKDELLNLRFIIGGSTGIDIILRILDAPDKLNDFFRLPVGPIQREDAEQIIQGLSNEYKIQFTPDATNTLINLIGQPVPYFIHLIVSQILLDPTLKNTSLTAKDIEAVYQNQVIGPACRRYFQFYRDRLKRYGKEAERAAIAILRTIAHAPTGRVSDSALFDVYHKTRKDEASDVEFLEIMADLECDWYVALDTATNEYYFLIDIMRDWWRRFYRKISSQKSE